MLRAILNKSWRQHPTRHQLYSHLPPITKTIQVRRTRHAGHSWRNRDELIIDVLLWTPTHGRAKAGLPARRYIQQLYEDTGCCPEDLPGAMNDREEWRERVRDIRATIATWWWYVFMYINPSARAGYDTKAMFNFSFPSCRPVALPRLKISLTYYFTHSWTENNWDAHIFHIYESYVKCIQAPLPGYKCNMKENIYFAS